MDSSSPDVEGVYETNVKPEFRALINLGCVCNVTREATKKLIASGLQDLNTFSLEQLEMKNSPYLQRVINIIYLLLLFIKDTSWFQVIFSQKPWKVFTCIVIGRPITRKECLVSLYRPIIKLVSSLWILWLRIRCPIWVLCLINWEIWSESVLWRFKFSNCSYVLNFLLNFP